MCSFYFSFAVLTSSQSHHHLTKRHKKTATTSIPVKDIFITFCDIFSKLSVTKVKTQSHKIINVTLSCPYLSNIFLLLYSVFNQSNKQTNKQTRSNESSMLKNVTEDSSGNVFSVLNGATITRTKHDI